MVQYYYSHYCFDFFFLSLFPAIFLSPVVSLAVAWNVDVTIVTVTVDGGGGYDDDDDANNGNVYDYCLCGLCHVHANRC